MKKRKVIFIISMLLAVSGAFATNSLKKGPGVWKSGGGCVVYNLPPSCGETGSVVCTMTNPIGVVSTYYKLSNCTNPYYFIF